MVSNDATWNVYEALQSRAVDLGRPVPARQGYEYGIPRGGTQQAVVFSQWGDRSEHLEQLYQAYKSCVWVSSCVDVVARSITAGGLKLVGEDHTNVRGSSTLSPVLQRIEYLTKFTNPREDMIQLLRSTITDLLVAGDAYLEVTWLAGEPVALYTLDASTMQVDADDHGTLLGYTQRIDTVRKPVIFKPDDVIHISLDAPRGGLYGTSPTDKALIPVVVWLFTSAVIKETMRKGNPRTIHFDFPKAATPSEKRNDQFWTRFMTRNLGPKNIGTPVISEGGVTSHDLGLGNVLELLAVNKAARDEIVGTFGVPPHKVGIIESGNLGGGTGESQAKDFRFNTCAPIELLVLEKLTYHIIQRGFGVMDHHYELDEVDYRDSEVVEKIRDQRLRDGAYTLNRYRAEIGEEPVDGGDDAVLVDRGKVIFWKDMAQYSQAEIAQMEKQTSVEAMGGELHVVNGGKPAPAAATQLAPGNRPGGPLDAAQGKAPRERGPREDMGALTEAYLRSYRARKKQALKQLPQVEETTHG